MTSKKETLLFLINMVHYPVLIYFKHPFDRWTHKREEGWEKKGFTNVHFLRKVSS